MTLQETKVGDIIKTKRGHRAQVRKKEGNRVFILTMTPKREMIDCPDRMECEIVGHKAVRNQNAYFKGRRI